MFQKFVGGDHLLEVFARYEEVLFAILLTAAQRPRGVGDRKIETRRHREQHVDERRLARSRGRRNDIDDGLVGAHSRFCTCSRDFSISAFMARPASVIFSASPARPEVLESSVFASRFISCSRKSSFLPTSPS